MSLSHWVMLKHSLPIRDNKGNLRTSIPAEQLGIIAGVEEGKGLYVCFPQAHTTVPITDLLPYKMPDVDLAYKLLREFCGHHCKTGQYQFNIKFHSFPPQAVYDECGDGPTSDAYNDLLEQELRHFMEEDEGITSIIQWVDKKWGTAGRSGGWLVLTDVHDRDWDSLYETWKENSIELENKQGTKEDRDYVRECREGAYEDLMDLALGVRYIGEAIRIAKAAIGEYVESDEPWQELREQYSGEENDEDDETQPGWDCDEGFAGEPGLDGSGSESEDAGSACAS